VLVEGHTCGFPIVHSYRWESGMTCWYDIHFEEFAEFGDLGSPVRRVMHVATSSFCSVALRGDLGSQSVLDSQGWIHRMMEKGV
jgi:hypothetical protein